MREGIIDMAYSGRLRRFPGQQFSVDISFHNAEF